MAFQVDRSPFDPESGFEYYICFKPEIEVEGDEVQSRISVEAAVSVSETGDVADLSFMLPKMCRNDHALSFSEARSHRSLRGEPRVYRPARLERRCGVQCSRLRWNWTTPAASWPSRSTAASPRPAPSIPPTRRRPLLAIRFSLDSPDDKSEVASAVLLRAKGQGPKSESRKANSEKRNSGMMSRERRNRFRPGRRPQLAHGLRQGTAVFGGQNLLQRRVQTATAAVGEDLALSARENDMRHSARLSKMSTSDCGPLGGIHAALRATETDLNLILSVDMPLMTRNFCVAGCSRHRAAERVDRRSGCAGRAAAAVRGVSPRRS